MTTQSIELNDAAVVPVSGARTVSTWQQLYWLLRREVWEYRSIWIAPFGLGMVILLAFLGSLPDLPRTVASLSGPDPVQAHMRVYGYGVAAIATFAVTFLVGVFYCLEALQGERRDRSILFWKSMPISDGTTVLSKAMIPLVVLPVVASSIAVILHVIMLMLSSAVLLLRGGDVRALAAQVAPIQVQFNISVLYAGIVIPLWHAPIYGWLLFLSGWARRAALVWAVLPPVALGAGEFMIFGTTEVFEFVKYMALGWSFVAFTFRDDIIRMFVEPTPSELLSTPSMWIGLGIAAAYIVGAVYMRRYREPG